MSMAEGRYADGAKLVARANICVTGIEWRRFCIPDEARFPAWVFYYGCRVSEAQFCANQHVFVVGGGNSPSQAVINLTNYVAMIVGN
jgi:thioredoxin reductase (NADPH)